MKKKGLIVISDYYKDISKNLLINCTAILKSKKYLFDIKTVSGSLEIPTLISYYIKNSAKALITFFHKIRNESSVFRNLICLSLNAYSL